MAAKKRVSRKSSVKQKPFNQTPYVAAYFSLALVLGAVLSSQGATPTSAFIGSGTSVGVGAIVLIVLVLVYFVWSSGKKCCAPTKKVAKKTSKAKNSKAKKK